MTKIIHPTVLNIHTKNESFRVVIQAIAVTDRGTFMLLHKSGHPCRGNTLVISH